MLRKKSHWLTKTIVLAAAVGLLNGCTDSTAPEQSAQAQASAGGRAGKPDLYGFSTKFDPTNAQRLEGLVSRLDWSFPRVHVFMIVEQDGEKLPWYVELPNPQLLELNGWSETTLKAGDPITVDGFRARDGSRQVWGDSIVVAGTGQRVFDTPVASLLASIEDRPAQATPRWPEGTPRLGAAPGDEGYWIPTRNVIVEDGVNVEMAVNGLLANIEDAARVAPLQEWALRLYERRQRNFLRSDPSWLECRPPSGPRKFTDPFGIQLLEDRPLQRVFVIAGGGNHDWHLIYTDGRALDSEVYELDYGNLLYYGRNTARWEGDTFVIESEGYNEKFWLPGGLPHSDQMHATERLTRVDYDTMRYEITINDPGTYTRPWKASWDLKWLDGQDPPEHYCQDNRL